MPDRHCPSKKDVFNRNSNGANWHCPTKKMFSTKTQMVQIGTEPLTVFSTETHHFLNKFLCHPARLSCDLQLINMNEYTDVD